MSGYTVPALIICAVILYILMWIFVRPVKAILKIIAKGALGYFALMACNGLLASYGICIGLNFITLLVCGVLGFNGFLLLLGINFIM